MRMSSEIINILWVCKQVRFFREICTSLFLKVTCLVMQHVPHQSLQGGSTEADCPILHTWSQGTCFSYIFRNGINSAAFITVAATAMVVLLLLATVCFFLPVLYPTKWPGQLEHTERAFLFLPINYTASLWSLMLLLWTLIKLEEL